MMPFLLTAAAASATYVTYHYATPIIITVCSTLAGAIGGYFWKSRSQPRDPALDEKLQILQNETIKRRQDRDEALEQLAATTESVVKETASSRQELHQKIEKTNQTLEAETTLLKTAHQQLIQVSTLIEYVGESIGKQGEPLLSELKNRLTELGAIYQGLSKTQLTLANTVEQLQSIVEKHHAVQEQLQSSAALDQNTVKTLLKRLENPTAKSGKVEHKKEKAAKPLQPSLQQPLQTDNKTLKSLVHLYGLKLKEAGEEINRLRCIHQSAEKEASSETHEHPMTSSPAFFH